MKNGALTYFSREVMAVVIALCAIMPIGCQRQPCKVTTLDKAESVMDEYPNTAQRFLKPCIHILNLMMRRKRVVEYCWHLLNFVRTSRLHWIA